MSEITPILKDIHDRFDIYERYPYTDHSVITQIAINGRPSGYEFRTYPGGCGTAFDQFVVQAEAPGGLFGEASPSRVQTSRDMGRIMILSVGTATELEGGAVQISGTTTTPPKVEGLVLPGDDGFDLFEDLHRQARQLRVPLTEALAVAGVVIEPDVLQFTDHMGSTSFDHHKKEATHHRSTSIFVGEVAHDAVALELDAILIEPFTPNGGLPGEHYGSIFYRSGEITTHDNSNSTRRELDIDELIAFSGFHREIEKLYR